MKRNFAIVVLLVGVLLASLNSTSIAQDNKSPEDRIAKAANRLKKRQQYELKYKMNKGETIRWKVEHAVSTKIQMDGSTEESSSRSVTEKSWTVKNVDSLGNITFVHSIEAMSCWQKIGDEDPVIYDSKKTEEVPEEYEVVAGQIGKPLAVFSIKPNGTIIDRKSALRENSFGVGKITIPLPDKPVSIGSQWNAPTLLNATDELGNQKKLKARVLYELTEVRGQYASIKFRTEILTPVKSQKVKSTIMQQMTDGYIVFDMKNGRQVAKQVQWDEKAVGFEGPDSLLTYVGKMTEKLLAEKTGQTSAKTKTAAKKSAVIKTADGDPVLRLK